MTREEAEAAVELAQEAFEEAKAQRNEKLAEAAALAAEAKELGEVQKEAALEWYAARKALKAVPNG